MQHPRYYLHIVFTQCSSKVQYVEIIGCRVQQVGLEYLHLKYLHPHRYEIQYHQFWPGAAACRTRGRSPQVGSSTHSREGMHSPDHPRVGHLLGVYQRVLSQDSHSHRSSRFLRMREQLFHPHMDSCINGDQFPYFQQQSSRCVVLLQEVRV